MQKNKVDVVKAVCNSAARKLAVLSLAVAVSGGAVASAQMPKEESERQQSIEERLDAVDRQIGKQADNFIKCEDRILRAQDLLDKLERKKQNGDGEKRWLQIEIDAASGAIDRLREQRDIAQEEYERLQREKDALLQEISADNFDEQDSSSGEDAYWFSEGEDAYWFSEDDDNIFGDGVEEETQRDSRIGTTSNTTQQDIVRNVTTLSGQMVQPQQNQPDKYFGGMLNPLNWRLFGGSSI